MPQHIIFVLYFHWMKVGIIWKFLVKGGECEQNFEYGLAKVQKDFKNSQSLKPSKSIFKEFRT